MKNESPLLEREAKEVRAVTKDTYMTHISRRFSSTLSKQSRNGE